MEDGAAPAVHSSEELSAIQSELSQLRAELGVEGGGDSVELVIKTLTGQHVNVRCPADGTVRDVKATIAAQAVRAAASLAACLFTPSTHTGPRRFVRRIERRLQRAVDGGWQRRLYRSNGRPDGGHCQYVRGRSS